jgi:hypothetical protein
MHTIGDQVVGPSRFRSSKACLTTKIELTSKLSKLSPPNTLNQKPTLKLTNPLTGMNIPTIKNDSFIKLLPVNID